MRAKLLGEIKRAVPSAVRSLARQQLNNSRDRLLNWCAITWRKRFRHVTFIGVTGSCGKTTTTRLVGAVLGSGAQCCIGAGNNAHQAVIKNVLSVNRSTKFCVQEISGSRPGRISRHFRVLQPSIGIVTTIGSDHYTNYRSLEATAREKGQLVELLAKKDVAILNADDPHVLAIATRASARVITFGRSANADVRATDVSSSWPDRLKLTVTCGDKALQIQTKLVGEHWTTSVLAAVTCGIVCGLDLNDCVKAVENFEPVFGRYSVHVRPDGPVYVFDHKAPFWTIAVGLAFVKGASAPRKTIVLGTRSDYPGAASRRYRRVAQDALEVADRVVFVGPHSGHVNKLKGDSRERLLAFVTTYQASAFLATTAVAGELVYIKGSIVADHLERIMLSQLDRVVCWQERCGIECACIDCAHYRTPMPPPLGLADDPFKPTWTDDFPIDSRPREKLSISPGTRCVNSGPVSLRQTTL